ncbi:MAG: thiol-disulfide isomerase, partial [Bryobacterales bacterium]|nr:thiol-disulfide isomerase [Bryobacterales bacterium]
MTTKLTFNGEIIRIIQQRCGSCHRDGGSAPMSLLTYEEARPWAKAIK